MRNKILYYTPFITQKDGKLVFDKNAVKITNEHLINNEPLIIRGRIFDRNGVVLAETKTDPSTGKPYRIYTYGPEFFPVIGYYNNVFGSAYLESILDKYLTGSDHKPIYKQVASMNTKYQLGDDVVLTIDSTIQNTAFQELANNKGAVVVLNIRTGAILAMVSKPSFDPNIKPDNNWMIALHNTETDTFFNRAMNGTYPPGSTFKVIDTAAWLESKDYNPDLLVDCSKCSKRYDICNDEPISPGKDIGLNTAFAKSCNVFFANIGVELGMNLSEYAYKFGFNKSINIIPSLNDTSFNSSTSYAFYWMKNNSPIPWTRIDFLQNPKIVAQGAIGQNVIQVTPLQMALVASTIANRGELLNPYILRVILEGNPSDKGFGRVIKRFNPLIIRQAIKFETAKRIKDLMVGVMQEGTGKDLDKLYMVDNKYVLSKKPIGKEIEVAAKTGTSDVKTHHKPNSWFICFAPANDPMVAVAVVAEHAGYGSQVAGPIAMKVLMTALNEMKKE